MVLIRFLGGIGYGTSLRTVVRELRANDIVECSENDEVGTT